MIDAKEPHGYRGVDDGRLACCEICQAPERNAIHSGYLSITWTIGDDGLGRRPCPCWDCRDWHLVGVGKFVQGSGFDEAEAAEILAALRAYRAMRDVAKKWLPQTLSGQALALLRDVMVAFGFVAPEPAAEKRFDCTRWPGLRCNHVVCRPESAE